MYPVDNGSKINYFSNFCLIYQAHKYDPSSPFFLLPPEIVQIISFGGIFLLYWVKTEHEKCNLTMSDGLQTAANLTNGYRVQPFYSETPITSGKISMSYFIQFATPHSTVEIGLCNSEIFDSLFSSNSDSCDCQVRTNQNVCLYSWFGGDGFCFGLDSNTKFGGYNVQEDMIMEINMNERTLTFYKEGTKDFEVKEEVAHYTNIPKSVIPICYLLGSGFDSSVTLKKCILW
jgi:hypothetical protein